ncbi:tyrosine-type recombinase/integrase [Rhodococcus sp. D-6]|uniref:Tyrosine-type recombinase/integrase n=1 Tax=Rhodococcus sp. D-6 TaxID=1387842 RepID=A0AAU7UTQ4_9NOCA|nr:MULTISPECIES: site-specific integrase [Rhodococcus]UTM40174.1 tyrosine-type recombinase/integrase [Rhodococcus pyridinivorans]
MKQSEEMRGWRLAYARPSRRRLTSPVALKYAPTIDAREAAVGIRPGQPFLLSPTGRPDIDVSLFFASDTFTRLAADSQASYAMDLKVFLSFLAVQGVDWRDATHDDLADFEFWRRRDDRNPRRVSAAKFSRELAAISKFYSWQQHRGTVSRSPVVMVNQGKPAGPRSLRPELLPKSVRSTRVKWLTPRAYVRWRDIGLGGYLPDGTRDERWRGRNDGRNLALAETLWSSGLRLREGGSLVLAELPSFASELQYTRGRVSESVAKGGRGRDFWISGRTLKLIDNYCESTRREAVHRAQREGRYTAITTKKVVDRVDHRRIVHYRDGDGRPATVPLDNLDWKDRLDFFVEGESGLEPWMLWLSEAGLPLPYRTWEAVFSTANARCHGLGVDIRCHPHMLRHSFALRMLVALIYTHDLRMGITAAERREFRHLFGDPWVLVQTMLGHANLATTRDCYLEPVSGLQVELFLNSDPADGSLIDDLVSRVAQLSPRIQDSEDRR